MVNEITQVNFRKALKEWVSHPIYHAADLAPFFAIQEAQRAKDNTKEKNLRPWIWGKRSVEKCQQIVWHLTGEWGARRNKTIENPKEFHKEVTGCVTKLATKLNRHGITALRDMKKIFDLDRGKYKKIVREIEENVKLISRHRDTKELEPVLGSKVLHHFFPTIVPVYDKKYISERVLELKSFKVFLKNNKDGWLFKDYAQQTRMQEYHHYFAYCVQQISDSKKEGSALENGQMIFLLPLKEQRSGFTI